MSYHHHIIMWIFFYLIQKIFCDIDMDEIIEIKENIFIYIGNNESASDIHVLQQKNISFVLNVAKKLDIHYEKGINENKDDIYYTNEHQFPIQYAKVGLIDGNGNRVETLDAAVSILEQFIEWAENERDLRKKDDKIVNILVHCRHGKSRSPTILTLFLIKNYPHHFPTFDHAWTHIKNKRSQIHKNHDLISFIEKKNRF